MLPLACTFASANENEKKHSLNILEKSKLIIKQSVAKLRSVIADSQYSDSKLRGAAGKAVIPYPSNQKRGVKDVLRGDKKFRTYGPDDEKKQYHQRTSTHNFGTRQRANNQVWLVNCLLHCRAEQSHGLRLVNSTTYGYYNNTGSLRKRNSGADNLNSALFFINFFLYFSNNLSFDFSLFKFC